MSDLRELRQQARAEIQSEGSAEDAAGRDRDEVMVDLEATRLSTRDAIAQCPTDTTARKRAKEHLRQAAQLLEGER